MGQRLRKIERKLDWLAVPHVTIGLVIVQVLAFLLSYQNVEALNALVLDPRAVWAGEVWRLVTFVALPPARFPLFAIFYWYLFWLMGSALDREWGTFRYNLFLLIAIVMTAATSMIFNVIGTNEFIGLSVFLAFAALYPNFQLLLFFILPVRVKWLALIAWGFVLFSVVFGVWQEKLMAAASVVNVLLFFGKDIVRWVRTSRHGPRRLADLKPKVETPTHKCSVCGRDSTAYPTLDFRYDYDGSGSVACFCEDHLPTGSAAG